MDSNHCQHADVVLYAVMQTLALLTCNDAMQFMLLQVRLALWTNPVLPRELRMRVALSFKDLKKADKTAREYSHHTLTLLLSCIHSNSNSLLRTS